MLTLERLQYLLWYDPHTGAFIRRVTIGPFFEGERAGARNRLGYRQVMVDRKVYLEHRLAWFYIYGKWPENHIDHINRDKSDNRMCNLRECTRSQNEYNKGRRITNTSGVTGVTWVAKRKKWQAQIRFDGTQKFIGRYESFEDAVLARKEAEKKYHKEFVPEESCQSSLTVEKHPETGTSTVVRSS